MSMLIKAQGEYSPIATIYQKQFGTYFPANGIYVKIDGEYTSQGYSWNNGPIIDAIIPIGSSTTLYALVTGGNYGNQVQTVRQRFCEMSMDLPVVSSGFSLDGGNTQTGRNSIDSALSNINAAGIAAKGIKLGFPINLGNNDIVGYRYSNTTYSYPEGSVTDNSIANTVNSWPVATQEKKDLMIQNLTYIVNAIYASGHEPMLGTVNPRGGRAVFEAFREWNDNLYKPLIQQLCPQWVNTDGDPVYDMEDLYWKWVPSTYTDAEWYDSDGTHPSPIAMDKVQRYLAQSWGRYARAPRLTNQTRSIIFVFSSTYVHDRGGINQLITNPSPLVRQNNQFDLIDRRGNVKLGSSINLFSPSNAIIYYGGADKGNLGDYTISLNSRYVQGSLTYSYSPLTLVYSEGVQSAGKTGIVKISASSNVSSTWRFGYEVQGVSKYINPTLPGPQIVEFTATLDASGSVTVNLLREAGAWGISGAEFIFD
jgi:hypothetical protein